MFKNSSNFVWDYDLKKSDTSNPAVKKWFLTRQLFFGDLKGIAKADLEKYLPSLNINKSLKELLTNFIAKPWLT